MRVMLQESLELLVLLFPHVEPNLRAVGRFALDGLVMLSQ